MKERIKESRLKAAAFLKNNVNATEKSKLIKKCSSFHDVTAYPDMMLTATYNATNALTLLREYDNLSAVERKELADFINGFQREDGRYRFKEIRETDIWKDKDLDYTWEYLDFHITNYSAGALYNIGERPKYNLEFIEKYESVEALKKWLDERIMTDPWLEGNNIVNLASFFIMKMEEGKESEKYRELLEYMLQWHEDNQDPETGYWGTDIKGKYRPSQLFGMAGAAHNFHLYFYFNRKLKYVDKIVDYCIDFLKAGVRSACLDVDVVDVLVNMLPYDYRKDDILQVLREYLIKLLDFQNEDGGFCDELRGVRRMDGWVKGYWEPQGLSNCFATWFRMATIGMIDCALHPEDADNWKFRNTIGIGYFNPNYLKGGN